MVVVLTRAHTCDQQCFLGVGVLWGGCHTSLVTELLHILEVAHSGVNVVLKHLLAGGCTHGHQVLIYLDMVLAGLAYFSCDVHTHMVAVL